MRPFYLPYLLSLRSDCCMVTYLVGKCRQGRGEIGICRVSHQVGDETSPCQQAWKKQPSILLESAVVHVEIVYAQGPDVWAGAILRLPPDASPRRPVGHVKWTKFDVAGRLATPATGESRKIALNEGRISGFLVFPSYFTCRKKGGKTM